MSIIHAVILGIVEGLTEFLPISSTAHLIFTSSFLHIPQTQFTTFFEVFIQSGAILAVVVLYSNYILKYQKLIVPLIVSFIPTAIMGLLFHKLIKTVFFESPNLIVSALFIVGLLFIAIEYLISKKQLTLSHQIGDITLTQAVIIGVVQSCAIVPGVSRAGAVMLGMMYVGYKREDAAVYSFLLAIPTIIAASGYDLLKTDFGVVSNSGNIIALSVGFVVSFATALVVIKWFISYLQKNTLTGFGIYRIILSAFMFLSL